jgi:hypothetical protein
MSKSGLYLAGPGESFFLKSLLFPLIDIFDPIEIYEGRSYSPGPGILPDLTRSDLFPVPILLVKTIPYFQAAEDLNTEELLRK